VGFATLTFAAAQPVQAQGKVEIGFQTFRTPLDQLQWMELPVEAAETRLATPFTACRKRHDPPH
jgi:hypothetical protein